MRKACDEDIMRDALRYASAMLGELRTSQLAPQKYFDVYMTVFDQLVNLEIFFADERSKGQQAYGALYELVQHAGNVLPRLYLMVTVGCLYIKSKEAKAKEILKDLVELCKGVQHPTRGLFLRAYLCQRSKGLLPDTGSEYEGNGGGNVNDAVDFLLSNFIEMNKLWVRMQHQGSARNREKRETERQQLQDLVGKNLTYLSQLDGMTYELYSGTVLPKVMEQIVSCKDGIAQQYLMQCVIQGFPDEFHLGTLGAVLNVLPELQPDVKLPIVMASLMDRLARYATTDMAVLQRLLEMKAFERFQDAVSKVLASQVGMAAADKVEMFVALLNFTGSVLPSNIGNVNAVLSAAYAALSSAGGLSGDMKAERGLVALLTIPLTKYDVVTGLGLSEYPLLMGLLRHRTHKDLATKIILTIVESGTRVGSEEKVAMLFRFVAPLVRDSKEGGNEDLDDEDMEREQVLVARLLHSLYADDASHHFRLLAAAKQQVQAGGPRRLRHTLPALGFAGLAIVRRLAAGEAAAAEAGGGSKAGGGRGADEAGCEGSAEDGDADGGKTAEGGTGEGEESVPGAGSGGAGEGGGGGKGEGKASTAEAVRVEPATVEAVTVESVLQWVLSVALSLADVATQPALAVQLLLAGGLAASEEAKAELLAYAFFEEAFTLYEERVSDQRSRVNVLFSIIGALQRCTVFGEENRAALVQNASGYASRLLKRSDQCRAACACSHLSWQHHAPAGAAGDSAVGGGGGKVAGHDGGKGKGAAAAAGSGGGSGPVRDASRVMASLKRAIKAANAAKQQIEATARAASPDAIATYVSLYIDIFHQHLYYYDRGVDGFSPAVLQALIDLIQGELAARAASNSASDAAAMAAWGRTAAYVKARAAAAGAPAGQDAAGSKERYAALTVRG
uniref:Vacuolar protein sorting-associated protein 35 n=1 Tax=Chlamydomonas euryale TaxID=1486919 RepID=A0A7R9YYL8_9CHLO|mmetsp:Transcript_33545/g.99865  ORF Transcript_33545/g.99865 Transcript_33545/m.99865 type:complete len:902 (+) Transcript_33545:354-3059(+)